MACEFCEGTGGGVLWQNDVCRVVTADEPGYPGFLRVILNRHVREMTDLAGAERDRFMAVVFAVETHVRKSLEPDKMNLASLGNMTPHLHWHVIPRHADDAHFPGPIWSRALREGVVPPLRRERAQRMTQTLPAALAALAG
jgi:diadenosine tetraphosphate (Ap4A) HIT family hydrolase